ncbi:hypothetical protein HY250_03170 [Candidatus Azambacteria bacterium]|nr:hypothetical protein [Candidatus Azambacteria bacterium]
MSTPTLIVPLHLIAKCVCRIGISLLGAKRFAPNGVELFAPRASHGILLQNKGGVKVLYPKLLHQSS